MSCSLWKTLYTYERLTVRKVNNIQYHYEHIFDLENSESASGGPQGYPGFYFENCCLEAHPAHNEYYSTNMDLVSVTQKALC